MPLNNKQANSDIDVTQFSTGVEDLFKKIQNPTIATATSVPGRELQKRVTLLKEMVNGLNKPILKTMATDMLTVMSSWLNDPQVLCCLIQGIWAAFLAKDSTLSTDSQLKLADSNFGKFLDNLIAFVDFIIIFLTEDVRRITFLIPDLIKEIMSAIMGAVLLVLQETSFALRDSVISMIFEWMDNWDTEQTWSKCLPLKQMINILKRYVHDYGLFADLFEKIKGYVSGMRTGFSNGEKLIPNAQDLEFLYWLRDLLIKLKKSVLNFDFCVDYTFFNNSVNGAVGDPEEGIRTILGQPITIESALSPTLDFNNQNKIQNYTTGDDGTILIDRDISMNLNSISKVSNSFLREFIHQEYGIPYEVIENTITRGTSSDHVQGTNVTSDNNYLLDKCANTPTAQETLRWVLNIKSR